jgi:hypothetical protein
MHTLRSILHGAAICAVMLFYLAFVLIFLTVLFGPVIVLWRAGYP